MQKIKMYGIGKSFLKQSGPIAQIGNITQMGNVLPN